MAANKQTEKIEPVVPMLRNDFLSVLVLGGIVGLLIWGLGMLFDRFVFDAYLCSDTTAGSCTNARNYAAGIAGIIGGAAGLLALIRLRVYRPLLVLLAALISLWGVVQLSWGLAWYQGVFVALAMYMVAFAAYSWIARVRTFWMALAATVVLVIIVRLALAM